MHVHVRVGGGGDAGETEGRKVDEEKRREEKRREEKRREEKSRAEQSRGKERHSEQLLKILCMFVTQWIMHCYLLK